MTTDRGSGLRNAVLEILSQAPLARKTVARLDGAVPHGKERNKRVAVALVQFDSVPGQTERNPGQMEQLTEQAVQAGARWVTLTVASGQRRTSSRITSAVAFHMKGLGWLFQVASH